MNTRDTACFPAVNRGGKLLDNGTNTRVHRLENKWTTLDFTIGKRNQVYAKCRIFQILTGRFPSGWTFLFCRWVNRSAFFFGFYIVLWPYFLKKHNLVWEVLSKDITFFLRAVEQWWRSGESTRVPSMWPWFYSQTRRHMWVEFVGSLLRSERFFPGYSGFPLSAKTNIWWDLVYVNFNSQHPQLAYP